MKKIILDNLPTIWIVAIFLLGMTLTFNHANANPVYNWVIEQKDKTVEYQKESWKQSKLQFFRTKQSLLDLFNKEENNESQD